MPTIAIVHEGNFGKNEIQFQTAHNYTYPYGNTSEVMAISISISKLSKARPETAGEELKRGEGGKDEWNNSAKAIRSFFSSM